LPVNNVFQPTVVLIIKKFWYEYNELI
jgi:hypothetical protein